LPGAIPKASPKACHRQICYGDGRIAGMDPLTAISFAGTVVQFVDFGTKIVKSSREIYKSISGSLPANEELDLVLTDLSLMVEKLRHPPPSIGTSAKDAEDQKALVTLCDACLVIARDLQKGLNDLKVSGKHRKLESLKQGLRSAWTEGKRRELVERLELLKDEMTTNILVDLRSGSFSASNDRC
jgi:hypothetical protein